MKKLERRVADELAFLVGTHEPVVRDFAHREALRRLDRSQSAAFRHKLLSWTLLLLALLPLLSIALPGIQLGAWVRSQRRSSATVSVRQLSLGVSQTKSSSEINWPVLIWLAGVFITLLPVAIGAISARRLVRQARPFETEFGDPGAEVLFSSHLSAPLTCGLWRPRILLPVAAEHWPPERLQAVLRHELAHLRRRDVASQITAHLIASLWWFQPLAWMLLRRLRTESELACDAEAVQSGLRPSAYAAELVAVARDIGRDSRLSSYAISMAERSDLEHRVRTILNPRILAASRSTKAAFLAALATTALAASAVTLSPGHSLNEQAGSIMKRTLLSGLLTSVGLSAGTLTGSIHDSGGAAVANAAVVFTNPDTGDKKQTTTDSEGRFKLNGASAGQYILKAEKPGFAPLLREFDLKAESNMDRQLTMAAEGAQPAAADVVSDSGTSIKALPIGGKVAQSNLVTRVQPVYPLAAKEARTQGTVQIEAVITKDGIPAELRVVSTPSSELAESALQSVRQWRYRPTLLNGEPVKVSTTVIVNYTLAP